uniref:Metalloendopeptidase n=1 Tax=Steinernema glaseri TaxID=37863 RepID=A0A1I7ZNL1_9BILA
MRPLTILFCFWASAYCFSIGKEQLGPDEVPLKGNERRKTGPKKSMQSIPGGFPPRITAINKRSGLDQVLVKGDITMTPAHTRSYIRVAVEEDRSKRQAFQHREHFPKTLWSRGVFYTFHKRLSKNAQEDVDAAVSFWQANTCINFTKTNDPDNAPVKPVLLFYPGSRCASVVGRNFTLKIQKITLGLKCQGFKAAAHEIAHALGFTHEQKRWDRDEYITVDMNKVKPKKTNNFEKVSKDENNNYGKPYDYGGIMHYSDAYGLRAFAIIKGDTVMVAKNPDYQMTIGGATKPVYGDVYEMNNLYSCYGTVCRNEGQPHPKNCSVCQCPSGFGGNDCSEREAPSHALTCGKTVRAGTSWQALEVTGDVGLGNTFRIVIDNPHHCTWHIAAPERKVIQFNVIFVGVENQKDDILCEKYCKFGGLRVKGQEKTWIPEGMKLCCSDQLNKIRTTASNLLIVQAYNSFRYTDFKLRYRMVDTGETKIPQATTLKNRCVGPGGCKNPPPLPSSTPPTTSASSMVTPTAVLYECNNQDGHFEEGACLNHFIICSNNFPYRMKCPDKLRFSEKLGQCTWEKTCLKSVRLSHTSVSPLPRKYIPELQKSMRAIPGYLPPNIPEINAAADLHEVRKDDGIVMVPAVTLTNAPVQTTDGPVLPIYVPYVEANSCFAKTEGIYRDGPCNSLYYACIQYGSEMTKFDFKCNENEVYDIDTHNDGPCNRLYYACIQNGSEMTKFDFKCKENEVYDIDTHKCLERASLRLCVHH